MKFIKILLLLIAFALNLQSNSHGLKMSRLNLSPTPNTYELSLQFDVVDLLQAVHAECPEFRSEKTESWNEFLSAYIYDHIDMAINEKPLNYQVTLNSIDSHFIHFTGKTNAFEGAVESISITNDCLISLLHDYSNVVSLSDGEDVRSFRLSKQRPQTKINL
ncbi:DUF6702 family protein [Marinoscillum sp. MHG1-6]|uniref:DUF6702 family protein n=1 Tax=Marinoscillum sp. MHG1-6 TaxID=2959627 RepID=UPI0021587D5B|nr:DUF6702 family protein [Marinoscillum sp. MHG1-6]